MVKGIHKRVIVVKSPDPRLFEQAIFIMKEAASLEHGTADQVLAEAQQVAHQYATQHRPFGRLLAAVPPPGWVVAGALLASIGWAVATFW